MFARKLRLTLRRGGAEEPVPKKWLERFFMRNFTGHRAFDDTLVAGDGWLEAGFEVDTQEAGRRLEEWLRGRKLIAADAELRVEDSTAAAPGVPKQPGSSTLQETS